MTLADAPKSKRKPGRPRASDVPSKRNAVLMAAINEFGTRGFDGASLSKIAKVAGGDTNLTRYYFGSKEDLWKAALLHIVETFNAELEEIDAREFNSATEKLKHIIRWFIAISAEWPQLSRLVIFEGFEESSRSEFIGENVMQNFFRMLNELSAEAYLEGSLPQVPTRSLFFTITHAGSMPMALPALTSKLPGGPIASNECVNEHADALIRMLFRG